MASDSNIWYQSLFSSATSGSYRISLDDQLRVAQNGALSTTQKLPRDLL